MEKLKIPVGISDFGEIAKNGYLFADKSLLIKDLLESGSKSILFTRPRRFGKTLALSMIDRFFNVAYADEETEADTFAGLKISKCQQYEKWKTDGTKNGYPVIRLDMSSITFSENDFEKTMTEYIASAYMRWFTYLKRSDVLEEDQKRTLFYSIDGTLNNSSTIFKNLCSLLTIHHGRKPIILIDEYDAPLNNAFDRPWFEEFTRQYGDFLKIILKSNLDVSRVVMTGVQRIVVAGMFSSLNDVTHIGVLNPYFDEYFGITKNEMKNLVEICVSSTYPGLNKSEIKKKSIQKYNLAAEWFDGYHIGSADIFNPWSAMNFLRYNIRSDKVEQYWNYTAENRVLLGLLSNIDTNKLEEIKNTYISGKKIQVQEISQVATLWRPGQMLETDDLFTLLLFAGYLTAEENKIGYLLSIPNREVRKNFDVLMERVYCFSIPPAIDLLAHIMKRDADAVKKDLQDLMAGGSYLDGYQEPRYKSWLHDLFALNGYRSITERESGEGRIDLLMEGVGNKPPIIFEFKVLPPDSDKDLLKKALSGAEQIEENRYADVPGMENAISLAVAFRKKTCEVIFPN